MTKGEEGKAARFIMRPKFMKQTKTIRQRKAAAKEPPQKVTAQEFKPTKGADRDKNEDYDPEEMTVDMERNAARFVRFFT